MQDAMPDGKPSEDHELYAKLLQLEELETLLEEIEECAEDGNPLELPVGLREKLRELGLSDADDVRGLIAEVHDTLDDIG